MDDRIDLSVVIPARNEEAFIGRALRSVARQAWPLERLEALVVDNGSTDGTATIVEHLAPVLVPLRVVLVSEAKPGRSRAKNRGAAVATGDILLFLDADSVMAPTLAAEIIAHRHTGYPAGSVRVIAETTDFFDRWFFELMEIGKTSFRIRAQMLYCSREWFERSGGFDESLEIAEDREFLQRLQGRGVPVCHLTTSWIATSPRRLHRLPLRLGLVTTFLRWLLAELGIGRRWRY
ncbi:glycosyltransferase [Thermomicrobium sp. 4228-Ro]|uniref:glycosyltransferase n=1 Tax=Thermomicrobium sp. 4228-Ro TaxID=2993937 RepID=UPI002248FA7D|nr:glycosyltransferase [Thermomicrobium sp. 4228-Ro]MCX2728141.1 glycosyltransferase [Thermomicrobium sp. 4228-Ro]